MHGERVPDAFCIVSIFLVVFPPDARDKMELASGWMSAPKRGGDGLERFGSGLGGDGFPLAGDSWLLHQKIMKEIGAA